MDFCELGEQMASLRRQQQFSQQKVADHVGISRSTLGALEKAMFALIVEKVRNVRQLLSEQHKE